MRPPRPCVTRLASQAARRAASRCLERLVTAPGPSGYGSAPVAVFAQARGAFSEDVSIDVVGSAVVRVPLRPDTRRADPDLPDLRPCTPDHGRQHGDGPRTAGHRYPMQDDSKTYVTVAVDASGHNLAWQGATPNRMPTFLAEVFTDLPVPAITPPAHPVLCTPTAHVNQWRNSIARRPECSPMKAATSLLRPSDARAMERETRLELATSSLEGMCSDSYSHLRRRRV
jgi:hypothetical protein